MKQIELSSEVRHLLYNQSKYINMTIIITLIVFLAIFGIFFFALYLSVHDGVLLVGAITFWLLILVAIITVNNKKKQAAIIKTSDDILVYEAIVVSDVDPRISGLGFEEKYSTVFYEIGNPNSPVGKALINHQRQKKLAKPGTMVILAKLPNKEQLYAFPFAR